jgi:Ca2+-binding RTX toxin-like protein
MSYATYYVDQTSSEDILQIYFDYYIDAYIDPETEEYFGDTSWSASYTVVGGHGGGFISDYGSEYGSGYLDIYSPWQPGIVHYRIIFHAQNNFSAVSIDETFDVISAYYSVDPVTIVGTTNNDIIYGGQGSDTLSGDFGSDRFYGGPGADTMIGGPGDDTYFDPFGDTIVEAAGLLGGTDFVMASGTFSLSGIDNVEYLTLTGSGHFNATGNALNNYLTGNVGDNRLRGGSGNDTLVGGAGNDTYVDPIGDTIIEFSFQGSADEVESSATFSLAQPGLAWIENLTLTGAANINGVGNALANVLTGNSGDNILNGGEGIDTMIGGAGNDTYFVDRGGDLTIEQAGGGVDLVSSSISRTLSAHIENLNLSGSANIDGNGNELDNTINGNTGANVLRGHAGNDVMRGNAGADTIVGGAGRDQINPGNDNDRDILRYASVDHSTGVTRDLITGMDLNNEDRFDFPARPTLIAAQVNTGTLNTATFDTDLAAAVGAAQLGAGQAVLFDPSAGNLDIAERVYLIVDANGVAGYQAGQDYVVELSNHSGTLTTDDFT